MCGIAGFIDRQPSYNAPSVLEAMGQAILHRGPDDHGVFFDPETGTGLVHRRLAIVDLTAAGHQPMTSMTGRYVIIFNGEIYNHQELRQEIERKEGTQVWSGHSDTETLLRAIDVWGLESALKRTVGMFALALYDHHRRQLHLTRDRMGEKPLYFGIVNHRFLFGSELKALRAHPHFSAEINRQALGELLRHQYIGGTHTIYKAISRVPQASVLSLDCETLSYEIKPYWSLVECALRGKMAQRHIPDEDALGQFESLMDDAIGLQMMADVPVGAFLSGGVDSSLIVALMQKQSTRPVKTFTIGFDDNDFNESSYARAVAAHLGTDHTEHIVTAGEALDIIPSLTTIYDEPFADVSQIPTCLVAKIARRAVTVSLSGDAGDELFGGYTTYGHAERLLALYNRLSPPARVVASWGATGTSKLAGLMGQAASARRLGHAADLLNAPDKMALCRGLTDHWSGQSLPVIGYHDEYHQDPFANVPLSDLERMMAHDMNTYLPDDILAKVDRAAMAVSLETRVPLLDHRIVEFALSLPLSQRRRGTEGKWIMRHLLDRYVPRSLIERPKKGFGVPLASWLRGPLRDWAHDLLSSSRLRHDGFFDAARISQAFSEHRTGRRDRHNDLWPVLMAQQWLDTTRR